MTESDPGQFAAGSESVPESEHGTATLTSLSRLRRELSRGTGELAVLSLLCGQPRYGYQLLKLLRGPGFGTLEIREGTLYPLLHRLEDAGHIAATWEAEGRSRPRKYYTITVAGRRHLALLRAEWSSLTESMRQLLDTLDEVRR